MLIQLRGWLISRKTLGDSMDLFRVITAEGTCAVIAWRRSLRNHISPHSLVRMPVVELWAYIRNPGFSPSSLYYLHSISILQEVIPEYLEDIISEQLKGIRNWAYYLNAISKNVPPGPVVSEKLPPRAFTIARKIPRTIQSSYWAGMCLGVLLRALFQGGFLPSSDQWAHLFPDSVQKMRTLFPPEWMEFSDGLPEENLWEIWLTILRDQPDAPWKDLWLAWHRFAVQDCNWSLPNLVP